jgi:hypothetical protein
MFGQFFMGSDGVDGDGGVRDGVVFWNLREGFGSDGCWGDLVLIVEMVFSAVVAEFAVPAGLSASLLVDIIGRASLI